MEIIFHEAQLEPTNLAGMSTLKGKDGEKLILEPVNYQSRCTHI